MTGPVQIGPAGVRVGPEEVQTGPRLVTLGNGLRVLLDPDPAAESVAMGFFVGTGARDEARAEMGVSHFLEHLLFKGSEEVDAALLNARLDGLGGSANAFTSDEATVYHAASLPERADELLETLCELMSPALRAADVAVERGVILEEIAMYADQPASQVFDALRAAYWGDHPLGHLVLGTPDTVSALTPQALRANLRARYGTASMLLSVSGRFGPRAVLSQLERLTADWPQGGFTRELRPHAPTPGLTLISDERRSRLHVAVSMPGVASGDPLREVASVLSEIVGGENGRLYWALLDSGLADGADLSHADYQETGVFEGGFSCDPQRGPEVLAAFNAVLDDIQANGVTDAEVRRAARKMAVGTLLRAETPQGRLFGLGMDYLALGEIVDTEEAVARCARVTPDDLRALLARRPFGTRVTVALGRVEGLREPTLPA